MTTETHTKHGANRGYSSEEAASKPAAPPRWRINQLLEALPKARYHQAHRELPALLDISLPTWGSWRRQTVDDTADIPGTKLIRLADWLGIDDVRDLLTVDGRASLGVGQKGGDAA